MLDLARQVWRLLDTAQQRECLKVLFILIVAAAFTLIGVAGIAPFFAVLSDSAVIERNAALTWLREALPFLSLQGFLIVLGLGFVVLLLIANAVNFLAILAIGRFSHNVGASLHSLLFYEFLNRDLSFHTKSNSAVLASQVVQEVNRTVSGVIQSGLTLIAGVATIFLIVGAVILVDPLVALGAVLLLGASYSVVYAIVRRRLIRNGMITTNFWHLRAKVISESFTAIKDIILFRARQEASAEVAKLSQAIASAQASTTAIAASPKFVLECATAAGLVAASLWIYSRSGPGQWLTHLGFFSFAAYRLLPALQQVFTAVARIRSDRSSFESIANDLYRARKRATQSISSNEGDDWLGKPRKSICLVDVSYRHSSDRSGGIDQCSLQIPAGSLVGLVGPNGSGKTTLVELILGLLLPDTGRIEIDGIVLDKMTRDAWMETIAYVPQHIFLLETSVAKNIAFGVAVDDIDLARVLEAARGAGLMPLLNAMPNGLATEVGQNGLQLSGGQRQRIGIARALYRRASLLVMDEATSALDMLAEAEVISLLESLRGNCTIVFITQRLNTLKGCDLLLELERGRLVEKKIVTDIKCNLSGVHRPEEMSR